MTPPYADYTVDMASMIDIAGLYNNHLAAFTARTGHGLCDLAAGLPPSRQLYDDLHFTDDGAQRVAELVLPCVQRALRTRR